MPSPKNDDANGIYNEAYVHNEGANAHTEETHGTESLRRCRFKKRVCNKFISASKEPGKKENRDCQCGYPYSEHSTEAQENKIRAWEWSYKSDSILKDTDAFGNVKFPYNGENSSKYIRVEVETEIPEVCKLMKDVWKLEEKDLLISVTGGAKDFDVSKRLKQTLRVCFNERAFKSGALIVTGGIATGITKAIGELVKEFNVDSTTNNPISIVGIATWGYIYNKKTLKKKGQTPVVYEKEEDKGKEGGFLDPNHTHFILVDDATQHKYGREIGFRVNLEKKLAEKNNKVLIVVNGDRGTLETVCRSLQSYTPSVVIVKGSGGAADILTHAYQNAAKKSDPHWKKPQKSKGIMGESLRMEIRKMLFKQFRSDVDTNLRFIEECLDHYDFLSVFEHDSDSNETELDVALLHALFEANSMLVSEHDNDNELDALFEANSKNDKAILDLALDWDRIDVAKKIIRVCDRKKLMRAL